MKIRVEVTQEDISMGVRGSPVACPIARSMRRSGHRYARVGTRTVYQAGIGNEYDLIGAVRLALPDSALEFIRSFDQAKEVAPMSFEIESWPA